MWPSCVPVWDVRRGPLLPRFLLPLLALPLWLFVSVAPTFATPPATQWTTFRYDALGRVVKVEEYTGTSTTCSTAGSTPYATTTSTYDRLGNQTTLQYDTLSRKTQMQAPDLGTWTYQYDLNGNLTRQTDAKSHQLHFQYDSLHRRVQKDYGTQKARGGGRRAVPL